MRAAEELTVDQLPSTPARELYRAILAQRAPGEDGIRPAFSMSALMAGLDDETRGLAQAIVVDVTGPSFSSRGRSDHLRRRPLFLASSGSGSTSAPLGPAEILAAEGRGDPTTSPAQGFSTSNARPTSPG